MLCKDIVLHLSIAVSQQAEVGSRSVCKEEQCGATVCLVSFVL